MNKILFISFILLGAFSTPNANADQLGVNPVPTVQGVTVQTAVQYDDSSQLYTYSYRVNNPASNTGSIWNILVDIKGPYTACDCRNSTTFTIPRAGAGDIPFLTLLQQNVPASLPIHYRFIPFGITAPSGWMGMLTVNGLGGFAVTTSSQLITPGQTVSGLSMTSFGLPTIKTMNLTPNWVLDMGDSEPTLDQQVQAQQVQQSLVVKVPVLAPSWVIPGSFNHWDEVQADLNQAAQLGWISDATLTQKLQADLQAARAVMNTQGPGYTGPTLKMLLADITGSTSSQRNQSAYDVLYFNVTALINSIPPSPPPPVPQQSPKESLISPATHYAILPVGSSVTITAQVVDQANNNVPITGFPAGIEVSNGPNQGVNNFGMTDPDGKLSLTYTGKQVGTDTVQIGQAAPPQSAPVVGGQGLTVTDTATIVWTGGPDLAEEEFIPPMIEWNGISPIHLTDIVKNIGNTSIPATTTRYYLSTTTPVDPNTARVIGERPVPALAPDQESTYHMVVSLPSDLGAGTYYLQACANWDHAQGEVSYGNNCVANQLVAAFKPNNPPPDCSHAGPTIATLWPPNHKMASVGITGVKDPSGLALSIAITGIQQDEPVNATGDGNTTPDGTGIDTSTAQVRAERSGIAQGGRLYFIAFKATNTVGGSCTGTVQVGVPHDQGQHSLPVDNGQRYDSTQP